ncbi:MAG TPA: hypothetical protein VII73_07455 [Caulobacteraceae bacterium]
MDNPLEFVGKPEADDAAVADDAPAQTPQDATAETTSERPRDASGRFASAAPPEAASEPETPAAPPPAPPPAADPRLREEGHVPISAMLDEREKRQALEKELAAYKANQSRQEPSRQPQIADPAVEQRLYVQNLEFSRRWATKEYGADTVTKAYEWANARCEPTSPAFDPIFNQQIATSKDPYETVVQAWKREQLLAKVSPDDLDEYTAWKAAKAQAGRVQPSTQQQTPQPPPPRSLANAPGSGGAGRPHVPVGDGEAFNSLFKG